MIFIFVIPTVYCYFQFERTTKNKDLHAYCASNETVPQFLTRYTKRFIQKFKSSPFFSFTWFAYPFHDYNYALGSLDETLLSLFQYLKDDGEILKNSLIVFVADHGERDGFFKSEGIEGYIERGLPPLFIRLPEKLREMIPNVESVVKRNAVTQLISPFDLHHTFLHFLSLGSPPTNPPFQTVLSDRVSLLEPIEANRTCVGLHIFPDSCVCNTLLDAESIKNPYYLEKITALLQKELRRLVNDSGYEKECAPWVVKTGDVISAQVVGRESNITTNLIRFAANPGDANYAVKIKIVQKKSKFDSAEIIGNLNRINRYGNTSSCVGSKTDKDKEMKAFCMCKSKVENTKGNFK